VAEHERCRLDCRSGVQRCPSGGATLLQPGRTGAADQRSLGDSEGQQGTANLEVSGRLVAMHLGRETPAARFLTAEATGSKPVTPTREKPQLRVPTARQADGALSRLSRLCSGCVPSRHLRGPHASVAVGRNVGVAVQRRARLLVAGPRWGRSRAARQLLHRDPSGPDQQRRWVAGQGQRDPGAIGTNPGAADGGEHLLRRPAATAWMGLGGGQLPAYRASSRQQVAGEPGLDAWDAPAR
jgi:hypothetical protein